MRREEDAERGGTRNRLPRPGTTYRRQWDQGRGFDGFDQTFLLQVRLDAACIISTMGLIPLIAVISSRAQDLRIPLRPYDETLLQSTHAELVDLPGQSLGVETGWLHT